MHYVYLLFSQSTKKYYIGETNNLKRRFTEHNDGKSKSTQFGRPWEVVYHEAFISKEAAQQRERKLKQYGNGLSQLKRRIGMDEWL